MCKLKQTDSLIISFEEGTYVPGKLKNVPYTDKNFYLIKYNWSTLKLITILFIILKLLGERSNILFVNMFAYKKWSITK